MQRFTKTFGALLTVMLISALTFGQPNRNADIGKRQQMREQDSDGIPGLYAGTSNFDYTKLISTNSTKNVLWDNGPFITRPGAGSGGSDYSEMQDNLGMGVLGASCMIESGYSLCDDFEVNATWNLTTFKFYAYQTNSGPPSTLNDVRVQIWDDNPANEGASVVWGDITGANLMLSTDWTNSWRVNQSSPLETRPIMEIVADVSGLSLSPGNYWVEYQLGGTGSSGPWTPYISILGETTTGNAVKKSTGNWVDIFDVGRQGLPFVIEGTIGDMDNNDMIVMEIVSPKTGMNFGMEKVTVKVFNLGLNPQNNFSVSYTFEGTTITETITATVGSLEAYEYTFNTQANLSTLGTYTIEACVNLSGDENPDNDCITKIIDHYFPEYCDASTTTDQEYIAKVVCGDINNQSIWQGSIADYTNMFTTILPGTSETITVSNGLLLYYQDVVWVWVDWNDNYEFELDEEIMLENVNGAGHIFTGVITAPTDVAPGLHRMRVRMTYNIAPTPCGEQIFGEIEDYSIKTGNPEICTPEYSHGCSLGDGFTDFALAEIENYGSGCANLNGIGYSQYFDLGPAELTAGNSYNLTMGAGNSSNFATIWIDFNDDTELTDEEQVLFNYALPEAGVLAEVEIRIPENALNGIHIMRARINYNEDCLDACDVYQYGETEDYYVNIDGQILESPNDLTGSFNDDIVTLNWLAPNTEKLPLNIMDSDLKNDFPTVSKTLVAYNVYRDGFFTAYVTETTFMDLDLYPGTYSYYVRAVYDVGESAPSNEITVEVFNTVLCNASYSDGCVYGDGFTDFALEEIENYGSGCGSLNGIGWSQYFELGPAILTAGETHTVTMASGYIENSATIWIDYNDDLIFAEDEKIIDNFPIEEGGVLYNVNFDVPASANLGVHKLRARTNWGSACDDPCALYGYGEAEDYNVEIIGELILPPANLTFEVTGNDVVLDWDAPASNEVTGYNVYHSIESGEFELLENVTVSTFTHESIDIGYHQYYVTATYSEGESSATNTVEVLITGIPISLEDQMNLFPNPASDFINITSNTTISSVRILNTIGQLVSQEDVESTTFQLNTSHLDRGIYFIKFITAKESITRTIIIQ